MMSDTTGTSMIHRHIGALIDAGSYEGVTVMARDVGEWVAASEVDALVAQRDELLAALKRATDTIQLWHGDVAWELYQLSPEMKQINAALARGDGA